MKQLWRKGMALFAFMLATLAIPAGAQAETAGGNKIAITKANFPDRYFRFYISDAIDKDKDGFVSEEERLAVKVMGSEYDADGEKSEESERDYGMWLSSWECAYEQKKDSLKGIEYFTELEYLSASGMRLDKLDLSCFPQLRGLHIVNTKLSSTLDLSKNPKLEELDIDGEEIKRVIFGKKKKLRRLILSDMNYTQMDMSKFPVLEELLLHRIPIKKLDISKNKKLTKLWCATTNIRMLDISRNKKLKYVSCEKNKLTKIKLPKTACALESLKCYRNQIKQLDLSKCSELEYLMCEKNKLTKLKLSKKTDYFERLWCFKNKLKSVKIKNVYVNELKKDKTTKCK